MSEPRPHLIPHSFSRSHDADSPLRMQVLGDAVGLERLGVHLIRIPPGQQAFVPHSPDTDEELIYVLAGRGVAELGAIEREVGAGDVLGFTTPSVAHHLRNRSDDDLIYLEIGERRAGVADRDGAAALVTARDRAELPTQTFSHPFDPQSELRIQSLSERVGLQRLGVHLIRVPAGKESYAFHRHHTEEELVYVLSGRGVAEIGDAEYEIGPGDFLGFPARSAGHHLRNASADDLVYLTAGERHDAEIIDYPRAGKRLVRVAGHIAVHPLDSAEPYLEGPLL